MKLFYKILLIIVLGINTSFIHAQDEIRFQLSFFKYDSNLHSQIAVKDFQFKKMPKTYHLASDGGKVYWFKLDILKLSTIQDLVAYIPTHNIDRVEVHKYTNNKLTLMDLTGNNVKKVNKSIKSKFPAFNIITNKTRESLYLKVYFPQDLNFPLKIVTKSQFQAQEASNNTISNFYYGIVLVIILVNLLLSFLLKDLVFFYYSLFLVSMTLGMALLDGTITFFFEKCNISLVEMIGHLFIDISLLLFSLKFLNLKRTQFRIVKIWAVFPLTIILLFIISYSTAYTIYMVIGSMLGISVFIYLWIICIYYYNIIENAKYYIFGYLTILIVGFYNFLGYGLGLYAINGEMWQIKLAGGLDMLVFSIAIIIRVNTNFSRLESIYKNKTKHVILLNTQIREDNIKLKTQHRLMMGFGLTNTEVNIAKSLLEGISNNAIAEKHFISINTVKYHLRNIYTKLEVTNKKEAIDKLTNDAN